MTSRIPSPMTRERFAALLDAYGGNAARWPASERSAAEALLASDPSLLQLMAAADSLDVALGGLSPADAPAQLRARVLEVPIRHPRAQAQPRLRFWQFAAWALVPCVLGVVSGALSDESAEQDDGWQEATSLSLLSDLGEEEWP